MCCGEYAGTGGRDWVATGATGRGAWCVVQKYIQVMARRKTAISPSNGPFVNGAAF